MAKSIALVACVARKAGETRRAADLYVSPWFRKASAYAARTADEWYILSAKYGLVAPDTLIDPYDETLNRMSIAKRRAWSKLVLHDLLEVVDAGDLIIILAGVRYREHLISPLRKRGCNVYVPMEGLSIGRQLRWLNQHT